MRSAVGIRLGLPDAFAENGAETLGQALPSTSVKAPSVRPAFTGMGRTNLPSSIQTVPRNPAASRPALAPVGPVMRSLPELGRDLIRLRRPAERRVRHEEHAFPAAYLELRVGGEVGEELAVRIVGIDLYGIGDDVLRHRRVQPDLADHAVKDLAGKGVHGEVHRLALGDVPHVRFIDGDPHLDMRLKSSAMRKRLGALKEETTVWPILTRLSMMTPFTGDLIVQ